VGTPKRAKRVIIIGWFPFDIININQKRGLVNPPYATY